MENQKSKEYYDLKMAYYTGLFQRVGDPTDLYNEIISKEESKPQSDKDIFNFLKNMASNTQGNILDSHFNIPLKLIPEFKIDTFNYIHNMDGEKLEIYLPDIVLSLNGEILKSVNGTYTFVSEQLKQSNTMKIKYDNQVYTIIIVKAC